MLGNLVGNEIISDTNAVYADKIFTEKLALKKGETIFEIHHSGQAHTPGDSYIWLPQKKVMFTGDIVYVERMLGVGSQSNNKSWISVFEKIAAYKPKYLIPGHGNATNLFQAKKDTYDYLVFLRKSVAEFIEKGGDLTDIGSVDQSKFNYLINHETLSGRNAQQVYTEIEWE